ncbi:MAG: leucyl/phenylalanyl-tRNA--protein transferase [Acidobacteria bacterium]|jgi:leucyl/phenylalanyl-tRNA--protein transferase|nr:leucyl/phenylalanyl-tRNA--protein transferase [Acidobacteriota bacterium]
MPIYLLGKNFIFPSADKADRNGIVAVGGDLEPERLLHAYANGIFPWFSDGEPILWWSPPIRMVLFPPELHISKSMKRILEKDPPWFRFTVDRHFEEVIENCRSIPRKGQPGTWITKEMREAYIKLHNMGFCHSLEVWHEEQMVGGIYGLSLGKCFFGESMFSKMRNASKFAFIKLAQQLLKMDFIMLDCQVPSEHLKTLGSREIRREEFLGLLKQGLQSQTMVGKWDF